MFAIGPNIACDASAATSASATIHRARRTAATVAAPARASRAAPSTAATANTGAVSAPYWNTMLCCAGRDDSMCSAITGSAAISTSGATSGSAAHGSNTCRYHTCFKAVSSGCAGVANSAPSASHGRRATFASISPGVPPHTAYMRAYSASPVARRGLSTPNVTASDAVASASSTVACTRAPGRRASSRATASPAITNATSSRAVSATTANAIVRRRAPSQPASNAASRNGTASASGWNSNRLR